MGELGSIPGSGRSPGEGNGNPLQYSCLENPMGAGAWWATVHGVAKSGTRLSDFTFTFTYVFIFLFHGSTSWGTLVCLRLPLFQEGSLIKNWLFPAAEPADPSGSPAVLMASLMRLWYLNIWKHPLEEVSPGQDLGPHPRQGWGQRGNTGHQVPKEFPKHKPLETVRSKIREVNSNERKVKAEPL